MFNDAPDPARCKFSTRGWRVLNPLTAGLLALSFLSYDSHSYGPVSRTLEPFIHFPRTFLPPRHTHFSVIRYSFLIFHGPLVYFPVSSFPIVRRLRPEGFPIPVLPPTFRVYDLPLFLYHTLYHDRFLIDLLNFHRQMSRITKYSMNLFLFFILLFTLEKEKFVES